MAQIAAAFGTSHSLMLVSRLQDWLRGFRLTDAGMPYYDHAGLRITYQDLLARAPAAAADLITDEIITDCFDRAQQGMAHIRAAIADAALDVLIIVGDDQHELFDDSNMPAMGIFYGETLRNAKRLPVAENDWFRFAQSLRQEPDADIQYPVDADLALHLIHELRNQRFDIAAAKTLRPSQFEGHAFSYVHRYCIGGAHLPIVPVFLNTWYPPNEPTPQRCLELGRALARAIETYSQEKRIGVLASGGLSHFVVDESMDRQILEALQQGTPERLGQLPQERLKAGSSEIRNWIVVAALAQKLTLTWSSYVPAYRSPALTGTGLAFATWLPA
jgi:hypothetical protein